MAEDEDLGLGAKGAGEVLGPTACAGPCAEDVEGALRWPEAVESMVDEFDAHFPLAVQLRADSLAELPRELQSLGDVAGALWELIDKAPAALFVIEVLPAPWGDFIKELVTMNHHQLALPKAEHLARLIGVMIASYLKQFNPLLEAGLPKLIPQCLATLLPCADARLG